MVDSGRLDTLFRQVANLLSSGRHSEAVSVCRSSLAEYPDQPLLHVYFGQALQGLGQMENAARCFQNALNLKSNYTEAYLLLGSLLMQTGNGDQSVRVYERLLQLEPGNVQACVGLGVSLLQQGNPDSALDNCEKALAINPGDLDAIALAANIDEKQGHLEQALERLRPHVKSSVTKSSILLAYAAVCRSLNYRDEAISALESSLDSATPLSSGERACIHFALGELLDASREYNRSFAHFRQGNKINYRGFDRSQPESDVNSMMAMYTSDWTKCMPRASGKSELPVFIVGMHRSGTSLVEQILACHPEVHGAGELPDIMQLVHSLHTVLGTDCRYLDCLPHMTSDALDLLNRKHLEKLSSLGGSAKRVVDKMPGNFMYLGFIEQLLPGARIIHCVRNPMDTCLSSYFQNFGGAHTYMNDLEELGFVYSCYHRMMKHWQSVIHLPTFEMQYERLVAEPEREIKRLVDFCGLPWDEQCMNFHSSRRYVNTASYDQVRQPMYSYSVNRWKNYETHLGRLRKALDGLV